MPKYRLYINDELDCEFDSDSHFYASKTGNGYILNEEGERIPVAWADYFGREGQPKSEFPVLSGSLVYIKLLPSSI